ncbi:exodeoxyribonuclease VII large subunit [Kiritimatiellota bacterium B12222]|nr:exodeoxyribonuclease VII large subunit [Kiritimatiellota bacterium B12222]
MSAEEPFKPKILSIREVTGQVRQLLEKGIGRVWIEGECSNVSTPHSGHIYFTLKDEHAQIQAAWFKGRRAADAVLPKEGMKLRAYGLITAYERGSQIQIMVEQAEDSGLGDLQKRFELLKQKLKAEGMFDADRKRPLPVLPRKIGMVTSPTGAAIRDMLQVLNRRYPDRQVLIAPVPVQGNAAANSIARAIDYFNQAQNVDVLIIGRGGGSLEDLWAFNEEVVARAIERCTIPLISAVGHEVDFTISDFVADLRAPTPSAAAELVVGQKKEFEQQVNRLQQRLRSALQQKGLHLRNRLNQLQAHKLFHEPVHLVSGYRQKVIRYEDRMQRALLREVKEPQHKLSEQRLVMQHRLEHQLRESQRHLDELDQQRHRALKSHVEQQRNRLKSCEQQLNAFNPFQVLRRGFSITRDEHGKVITDIADLQPGLQLETITHQGKLHSTLDRTEQNGQAS